MDVPAVLRPANWTAGGKAWFVFGVLCLLAAGYWGSPYFAASGLAMLVFAPLLAALKGRHLLTHLGAATGLFLSFLGVTVYLAGSMGETYVWLNRSLHATLSWPFDYSSETVYYLVRTVMPDHPLIYGVLYASLILGWIVFSLGLLWFRDALPFLEAFLFPMRWRWFAPYLFCVGFVVMCAAVGPVYRYLPFETRKSFVYVVFNIVTVWLFIWHVWLLLKESGERTKAAVFALLNFQVFFEVSFYAGFMLTHGMIF